MTNCDIRIWHTLAEVELFVFSFVIKLFFQKLLLQYRCLILFCSSFFYFPIRSLCIKIFICCCVCQRDRYWDNRHS